jgi:transposase
MGRPTKLNEHTHEAIVTAVRAGNYVETAAQAAGIDTATFYRWMERGEADIENDVDTPFRGFCEAVQKAKAESEKIDLDLIAKAAGEGNWQAAAWRLERRFKDKWGRNDKMKIEHAGSIGRDVEVLTDEQLDQLEAKLTGPPETS